MAEIYGEMYAHKIRQMMAQKAAEKKAEQFNPDSRYANMNQTQIEESVKANSSVLLTRQHTIPEESGKKLKFKVIDDDIYHLVDDALHRAKGVLYISDISELPQYFDKVKYVKSVKDTKTNRKGVLFHYYQLNIGEREMYLNIREDKRHHSTRLHSITTSIK